jgi:hypothetical protein
MRRPTDGSNNPVRGAIVRPQRAGTCGVWSERRQGGVRKAGRRQDRRSHEEAGRDDSFHDGPPWVAIYQCETREDRGVLRIRDLRGVALADLYV